MAASEKARAKAEQAVGKVAQAAGRATGNEKLIAKGRAAEAAGDAREAKESLKDTGRP
ncbi:CsbD family protein [Streptomyces sp. NPDC052301]|uniref:CsbD family protein n=1 Tax=Streptomyces sp. NPDC052301 TaxID=3365687 RepID=UPI0037D152EE